MENKKLERYQAWEQRLQELNHAQKAELLRADLAQKDAKEAKKRAQKIAAEYEDVLFRGAENYNPDPTPLFSETFGTVPLDEVDDEEEQEEAETNDEPEPIVFALAFGDDGKLVEARKVNANDFEPIEGEEITEFSNLIFRARALFQRTNNASQNLENLDALEKDFFSSPETMTRCQLKALREAVQKLETEQR